MYIRVGTLLGQLQYEILNMQKSQEKTEKKKNILGHVMGHLCERIHLLHSKTVFYDLIFLVYI